MAGIFSGVLEGVAAATSFTTFAASLRLISQEVSLIRHWAKVSRQPQSHFSEFMRFSAIFFCSADKLLKSTLGSSVASAAFFKNIWPVSWNVSIVASEGKP